MILITRQGKCQEQDVCRFDNVAMDSRKSCQSLISHLECQFHVSMPQVCRMIEGELPGPFPEAVGPNWAVVWYMYQHFSMMFSAILTGAFSGS